MSEMLPYKVTITDDRKTAGQNWLKPGQNTHLIERAYTTLLEHMSPAELGEKMAQMDTNRAERKRVAPLSWNYAEQVKDAVSVRDAAISYGIKVDRRGFALCPLHREKTASLHIYSNDRGWYCFGCHEGGSVIDLVQKLFGLSFMDAIRKLDEDFHLNLQIGEPRTPMQMMADNQEAIRRQQRRQLYDEAIKKAEANCSKALSRWVILDTIRYYFAPAKPKSLDDATLEEMDFSPIWAATLMLLPQAEYDLEQAEGKLYEITHHDMG